MPLMVLWAVLPRLWAEAWFCYMDTDPFPVLSFHTASSPTLPLLALLREGETREDR